MQKDNSTKKNYISPELLVIKIDAEITLALNSTPMNGPLESQNVESSKEDYFRTT